jgi:hypothetical protein
MTGRDTRRSRQAHAGPRTAFSELPDPDFLSPVRNADEPDLQPDIYDGGVIPSFAVRFAPIAASILSSAATHSGFQIR